MPKLPGFSTQKWDFPRFEVKKEPLQNAILGPCSEIAHQKSYGALPIQVILRNFLRGKFF